MAAISEEGCVPTPGIRKLVGLLRAKIALDVVEESLKVADARFTDLSATDGDLAANKAAVALRGMKDDVRLMHEALSDVCETHARTLQGDLYRLVAAPTGPVSVVAPGDVTVATFTTEKDAAEHCKALNDRAKHGKR